MSPAVRSLYRLPSLSRRFLPVWRRNLLVWRKLALPSVLGNLADPMIYMLGFGYGLGRLLPEVNGQPYIAFLAAGTICYSTMNSASFEALYSAFSRMHVQRTWDAILNAPIELDDVLVAELVWAASKAFLSGLAILLVIAAMGYARLPHALAILPVVFLIGLTFGAVGLIMTALAPGYDFFTYYFTLFLTPMTLLSGVFFPAEQLPAAFQWVAQALPLTHAVAIVRPLLAGGMPEAAAGHLAVLFAYLAAAFWLAVVLCRRRLLK